MCLLACNSRSVQSFCVGFRSLYAAVVARLVVPGHCPLESPTFRTSSFACEPCNRHKHPCSVPALSLSNYCALCCVFGTISTLCLSCRCYRGQLPALVVVWSAEQLVSPTQVCVPSPEHRESALSSSLAQPFFRSLSPPLDVHPFLDRCRSY